MNLFATYSRTTFIDVPKCKPFEVFLWTTDIHIPIGYAKYQSFIDIAMKIRPDAALVSGDMIEGHLLTNTYIDQWKLYSNATALVNDYISFYDTPGNHDLYNNKPYDYFIQYSSTGQRFLAPSGVEVFENCGWKYAIHFVNSVGEYNGPQQWPTAKFGMQIDTFDEEAQLNPADVRMVMTHYALDPARNPNCTIPSDYQDMYSAMVYNNVDHYLHGDIHFRRQFNLFDGPIISDSLYSLGKSAGADKRSHTCR